MAPSWRWSSILTCYQSPFKMKSPLCDFSECHTVKSPDSSPPFIRWHVVMATADTDKMMCKWGRDHLRGVEKPWQMKGQTCCRYWSWALQLARRMRWDIVCFYCAVSYCCSPTPRCLNAFLEHDSHAVTEPKHMLWASSPTTSYL